MTRLKRVYGRMDKQPPWALQFWTFYRSERSKSPVVLPEPCSTGRHEWLWASEVGASASLKWPLGLKAEHGILSQRAFKRVRMYHGIAAARRAKIYSILPKFGKKALVHWRKLKQQRSGGYIQRWDERIATPFPDRMHPACCDFCYRIFTALQFSNETESSSSSAMGAAHTLFILLLLRLVRRRNVFLATQHRQ